MKTIISKLAITIVALLSVIPAWSYDFEVEGIYYTKLPYGHSVSVSNKESGTFAKSSYSGSIEVPSQILHEGQTYDVTEIADFAFYKSSVMSVILPETITKIGYHSFAKCEQMVTCNIPSTVEFLGKAAFSECSKLESVNIPLGIHKLLLETFYGCSSIKRLVIPKNVMSIEYSSTTWASSGSGALNASEGFPCFANCKALTEIVFEDGERPISFIDTWEHTASNGALYANQIFYNSPIEKLYLGRTLYNSPYKSVFQNFKTLKQVKIGEKVSSIQDHAFENCIGLTSVDIPDNVSTIGRMAFAYCSGLEKLYIGNGVSKIPYGLTINCTALKSVFIGNGIATIESDIFSKCQNLKNVVICSSKVEQFKASNTPTTVVFYIPKENLIYNGYKASPIAAIERAAIEYNGINPSLKIHSTLEGASFEVTPNNLQKDVGSYNTDLEVVVGVDNWKSTFMTLAEYSITPAPLTIIANDVWREYKTENPLFDCTFIGFKNNENEHVLTTMPTLATTANINSIPGTYPIIPSGGSAQNYTFSYERGILTVTKAKNQLTWNQEIPALKIGEVVELNFSAKESTSEPSFTQYNNNIISLYKEGERWFVKALAAGTTNLTVQYQGNDFYENSNMVSKSITVNKAPDILAESITLNKTSITLTLGTFETLSALVLPDNTTNKTVVWTSNDENVAKVSSSGNVMAVGIGNTYITASCGNAKATCSVTVFPIEASNVFLDKTSLDLKIGEYYTFTATVVPEATSDKTIIWSSSNDNIATITENGVITAVGIGSAMITAKCGNASATCAVTVKPVLVESVSLNTPNLSLAIGESEQLSITVLPENSTNKEVVWASNDESVAIVSEKGLVTVLSEGEAIITATTTDGTNLSASCIIKCLSSGIEKIPIDSIGGLYYVYNLQGILIIKTDRVSDIRSLPHGIYFINGNKFAIH